MKHSLLIYLFIMVLVTNLIRVLPMTLIRRHACRDDLSRHHAGNLLALGRIHCLAFRHCCRLVRMGSFPRGSSLLHCRFCLRNPLITFQEINFHDAELAFHFVAIGALVEVELSCVGGSQFDNLSECLLVGG